MSEAAPQQDRIPSAVTLWSSQDGDLSLAEQVTITLASFDVPFRHHQVAADEPDDTLAELLRAAEAGGAAVHIVFDHGGASLATRVARLTAGPVLTVPVATSASSGLDGLRASADQPRGLALATLALGKAGAVNAALYAVAILALSDAGLAAGLAAYRQQQTAQVLAARLS